MRKRVRRGRRRKRPPVHKNNRPTKEGGFETKPTRTRPMRSKRNDKGNPWWF